MPGRLRNAKRGFDAAVVHQLSAASDGPKPMKQRRAEIDFQKLAIFSRHSSGSGPTKEKC